MRRLRVAFKKQPQSPEPLPVKSAAASVPAVKKLLYREND
jgi:hypothetical protein